VRQQILDKGSNGMDIQKELRDCLIVTLGPFFPDSDRVVGKPNSAADAIIAMLSCRSFSLDDASACYQADRAMEREQEDRDDIWRDTMNREPNTRDL
jgi:hypothetical protein